MRCFSIIFLILWCRTETIDKEETRMRSGLFGGLAVILLMAGCGGPSEEELMSKAKEAQEAHQYDESIAAYEQLIKDHPKGARRAEAIYTLASIYQNARKDYPSAIRLYRQLADEYASHPNAPSALFLVGFVFHNEMGEIDSARVAYQTFLDRYGDHEMAPSARFELANLGKRADDIFRELTGPTKASPQAKK